MRQDYSICYKVYRHPHENVTPRFNKAHCFGLHYSPFIQNITTLVKAYKKYKDANLGFPCDKYTPAPKACKTPTLKTK